MAVFAIDTSTEKSFLALKVAEKIFVCSSSGQGSHAEQLSDLFENLLQQAQIKVTALQQIVWGQGPGSFTGLRIGLSFVKGLALGLQIPVAKFSSLEACANALRATGVQEIYALADARRAEFFCEKFVIDPHSKKLSAVWPETKIISLCELTSWQANKAADVQFVACDLLPLPAESYQLTERNLAESLLHLAASLDSTVFMAQQGTELLVSELAQLQPNYVRLAAAKKIAER